MGMRHGQRQGEEQQGKPEKQEEHKH
jgi:hypothetical protein